MTIPMLAVEVSGSGVSPRTTTDSATSQQVENLEIAALIGGCGPRFLCRAKRDQDAGQREGGGQYSHVFPRKPHSRNMMNPRLKSKDFIRSENATASWKAAQQPIRRFGVSVGIRS
jgi:hypothetical protein